MTLTCARMTEHSLADAHRLLSAFFRHDEHYGDSAAVYGDQGDEAIRRALRLLLDRPELGFVWLGFRDGRAVATGVISFAVSTSRGALAAKLDDVYVEPASRSQGIGTEHFRQLVAELRHVGVERVDTSVHRGNHGARRFYERLGFHSLHEERLARLLTP